jgi:hypothetical protein
MDSEIFVILIPLEIVGGYGGFVIDFTGSEDPLGVEDGPPALRRPVDFDSDDGGERVRLCILPTNDPPLSMSWQPPFLNLNFPSENGKNRKSLL